jgi:hypothetical protein
MAITFPRELQCCPAERTPMELQRFQAVNLTGRDRAGAAPVALHLPLQGVVAAWKESLRGGLRLFKSTIPGHRRPVAHSRLNGDSASCQPAVRGPDVSQLPVRGADVPGPSSCLAFG